MSLQVKARHLVWPHSKTISEPLCVNRQKEKIQNLNGEPIRRRGRLGEVCLHVGKYVWVRVCWWSEPKQTGFGVRVDFAEWMAIVYFEKRGGVNLRESDCQSVLSVWLAENGDRPSVQVCPHVTTGRSRGWRPEVFWKISAFYFVI